MKSQLSILKGPSVQHHPIRIEKMMEDVVRTKGNNVAAIFKQNGKTRQHTFTELNNLANRLAKFIHQTISTNNLKKSNKGDFIIGIFMQPSDYMLIVMLAIWKVGAAYVPLDPNYPEERIKYIISDSQPTMIICDEDHGEFPSVFKLPLENFINYRDAIVENGFKKDENDLAVVLYTSGSTGTPKGACLSFKSIFTRLQWQFEYYPFSSTEKVCVFKTVFTFVDSIFEIWCPLLKGLKILVVPKPIIQNPEKFIQVLEDNKIERIILVPSLLTSILICKEMSGNKDLLTNLKLWISSGEILSPLLINRFYTQFKPNQVTLANFYGSTEISDATTYSITNPDQLRKFNNNFPLGAPLHNTIAYILDQNLNIIKEGEIGQICFSGQILPLKYISKKNQVRLADNPFDKKNPIYSKLYQTGDQGFIKDGLLFYVGRKDSLVKIRGHRVDLFEIESAINSIEGVKKGVVLCYQPGDMNQTILAFVKRRDDGINKKTIDASLRRNLPNFMLPKIIILIDTIPLLVNGKTDRQVLLKMFEDTHTGQNELDYSEVPLNQIPAAKVLFELIDSLTTGLLKSIISIHANFFEIGGNSLNAIFTVSKLKDSGYNISITDFIAAENLGEIVRKMQPNSHSSQQTEIVSDYIIDHFRDDYKKEIIDIITASFYQKSNLDCLIKDIKEEHYTTVIEKIWTDLVNQKLAFVIKDAKTKALVGASINYEAHEDLDFHTNTPIDILIDFVLELERPFKKEVFENYQKLFYANWLGTPARLSSKENVAVVNFVQQQILKLAKRLNYQAVITTNHSPITQQLGAVYGYKTLIEYQVNQYVASDNTKPFEKAPDSQTISLDLKVF